MKNHTDDYIKTIMSLLFGIYDEYQDSDDYQERKKFTLLYLLNFAAEQLEDMEVSGFEMAEKLNDKAREFLEYWFCDKDEVCPGWCEDYHECDCSDEIKEEISGYTIVANTKDEAIRQILKNFSTEDFRRLILDFLGQPYVDFNTEQTLNSLKEILDIK